MVVAVAPPQPPVGAVLVAYCRLPVVFEQAIFEVSKTELAQISFAGGGLLVTQILKPSAAPVGSTL